MKKHTLLLFFCFTAWALQAQSSAKRYVMIEHFTNTKCPTCASKNPAFYTLINQYPNDLHHLSVHPPIPYNTCGLYLANKTENSARATFYGVFGTPSIAIDGTLQPISTPLLTAITLQDYLEQTSPLWVQVSETGPNNARVATVKAHSLSALPAGNYKLYAAVVEKTVNFSGGNGETVHHDVFRKMLSDINGTAYTPAATGQSTDFTFNFSIDAGWNADEIYVLAWVQNTDTKEIINSGTRFDALVTSTSDAAPQSILIQPNPVDESAVALIGDDQARQVEIFASNGRRVAVTFENQESGTVGIRTASFPAGIYFVKITGEKAVYVAKMVKN